MKSSFLSLFVLKTGVSTAGFKSTNYLIKYTGYTVESRYNAPTYYFVPCKTARLVPAYLVYKDIMKTPFIALFNWTVKLVHFYQQKTLCSKSVVIYLVDQWTR